MTLQTWTRSVSRLHQWPINQDPWVRRSLDRYACAHCIYFKHLSSLQIQPPVPQSVAAGSNATIPMSTLPLMMPKDADMMASDVQTQAYLNILQNISSLPKDGPIGEIATGHIPITVSIFYYVCECGRSRKCSFPGRCKNSRPWTRSD